ncbi:MAG: hypothetical protein AAF655_21180 [Bacteroidota bacterium]
MKSFPFARPLLALHIFLCPFYLIAQKNFIPGYVIHLSQDTVRGYIDYRNWKHSPKTITFSEQIGSTPTSYHPNELLEFSVGQESYISAKVDLEVSSDKLSNLEENASENLRPEHIFLRVLFRGDKWLLYGSPKGEKDNFYINNDGEYELLVYKKYLYTNASGTAIKENKTYIGQLTLYLNDCEKIPAKLPIVTYTEKSLIQLFQTYYSCHPDQIAFKAEREKAIVKLGVLAGLAASNLTFSDRIFLNKFGMIYLEELFFDPSYTPAGGISFEIFLPRNRNVWSVNNELIFTSYDLQLTKDWIPSSSASPEATYTFTYSYLKINTMIRINQPGEKLSFFLNAGISNGFRISGSNELIVRSVTNPDNIVTGGVLFENERRYEQGILVGAGLKIDCWSLELRHEFANGILGRTEASINAKRNFLLVGYKF